MEQMAATFASPIASFPTTRIASALLQPRLVGLAPDVILAYGPPAVAALRRETRSIPIVFAQVSNPLGAGFVESMAHPGGNITGFTNFELTIGGKWLAALKEVGAPRHKVGHHFKSG